MKSILLGAILIVVLFVMTSCGENGPVTGDNYQSDDGVSSAIETTGDTSTETEGIDTVEGETLTPTDTEEAIEQETEELEEETEQETEEEMIEETVETPEDVDLTAFYQEMQVNELGEIMIVMYHGIIDNPPYHRTAEDFRKDLQYMYDNGYRLIDLDAYLSMEIDIEAGYTPILLTFDDGLPSTFNLIEVDGILVPDPTSAVGIMEDFIHEHPDFGRGSIFYVNYPNDYTFGSGGTLEERFSWLVDHGYDIGNHTATHANLSQLSESELLSEIGRVDQKVKELLPEYAMRTLSYPFGSRPIVDLRPLALSGVYDDIPYQYEMAVAVGPNGYFRPVLHNDSDLIVMPRARGSEGDVDLWHYFGVYAQYPERRYVSDGDPNTIVVPERLSEDIKNDYPVEIEVIIYPDPH